MLTGVVAFNALRVIDPSDPRALGILITGYFSKVCFARFLLLLLTTVPGLGFFMTFFYLGVYLLRYVGKHLQDHSN